MGPYQEQIKTEIKPEHYNNDSRQASVHIKPVELLDIHGKSPGKNIPCRCGKYSARNLVGKFQLAVGDIGIHHRKNKRHHTPGKQPPEMQQQGKQIFHLGDMPHYRIRE